MKVVAGFANSEIGPAHNNFRSLDNSQTYFGLFFPFFILIRKQLYLSIFVVSICNVLFLCAVDERRLARISFASRDIAILFN
jgi:hypothetical protein